MNYNVRYFLEQCLYAVLKATEGIDAEIIVADNHSGDGSIAYLQPLFPSVRFIAHDENLGFAKANNHALAYCKGEYVLFLNPDTLIPENSLRSCLQHISADPGIGALGVRMVDGQGKFLPESKRSFPTPWVSFCKLTGLAAIFPQSKIFNRYALGYLDEHSNHDVEVLAGACMMVRKNVLQELKGFDESYFLYGEDIDLSYRIQKAGYRNRYFAGTTIIHFKGESSAGTAITRVKHFYRAMLVFVQKHYPSGSGKLLSFFLSVAIVLRGALSAVSRISKPFIVPVTDIILATIWLHFIKTIWIQYVRDGRDFGVSFLWYLIPLLAIWFVAAAALTGSYDKKQKPSKALLSLVFATISTLALYALLPETMRFSRGVMVWGTLFSGVSIFCFHRFLTGSNSGFFIAEKNAEQQTIVVGCEKEYAAITQLLADALQKEPLGRVSPNENKSNAIGQVNELTHLQKTFPVNRIIFSIGKLSLEKIIPLIQQPFQQKTGFLFYRVGSNSIVGSKALMQNNVLPEIDYRITHPYQKRMKSLMDILMSFLFLLLFPFHFIFHPAPLQLLTNSLNVLAGRKTWIGYAAFSPELPLLPMAVIGSVDKGHPLANQLDRLYAKNYDWLSDVGMILKKYRQLGSKG